MYSLARTGLFTALFAMLALTGCTMSRDGGFNRAQRATLTAEGFRQTDRGWEFSANDRLLFATDDSAVHSEQSSAIRRIAGRLSQVGLRRAAVEGHADDTGSAQHNEQLSKRRADAVAAEMVAGGFPAAGLTTIGLGDSFPVESNRTREGRQQNRRVVILITSQ